jgi:hypothetical protein
MLVLVGRIGIVLVVVSRDGHVELRRSVDVASVGMIVVTVTHAAVAVSWYFHSELLDRQLCHRVFD